MRKNKKSSSSMALADGGKKPAEKPISLHPLEFQDAVSALVGIRRANQCDSAENKEKPRKVRQK